MATNEEQNAKYDKNVEKLKADLAKAKAAADAERNKRAAKEMERARKNNEANLKRYHDRKRGKK